VLVRDRRGLVVKCRHLSATDFLETLSVADAWSVEMSQFVEYSQGPGDTVPRLIPHLNEDAPVA